MRYFSVLVTDEDGVLLGKFNITKEDVMEHGLENYIGGEVINQLPADYFNHQRERQE